MIAYDTGPTLSPLSTSRMPLRPGRPAFPDAWPQKPGLYAPRHACHSRSYAQTSSGLLLQGLGGWQCERTAPSGISALSIRPGPSVSSAHGYGKDCRADGAPIGVVLRRSAPLPAAGDCPASILFRRSPVSAVPGSPRNTTRNRLPGSDWNRLPGSDRNRLPGSDGCYSMPWICFTSAIRPAMEVS